MTKTLNVSTEKNIALGDITFSADAIMLKGATVIGQAPPVTVQEDTLSTMLLHIELQKVLL